MMPLRPVGRDLPKLTIYAKPMWSLPILQHTPPLNKMARHSHASTCVEGRHVKPRIVASAPYGQRFTMASIHSAAAYSMLIDANAATRLAQQSGSEKGKMDE